MVRGCMQDLYDGMSLSQLELAPLLDLGSSTGQTLACLCRSLSQGMSADRFLERSPKAMALLVEAAVRLILEHTPHRLNCSPRPQHLCAVPRHVKRAIDYMQANMHTPITLTEIAAAAGVSARTLQIGFREFRQTTPLLYLRKIRLQAVRDELSSPENKLPVNEVALKWGFNHMGRFAAQYKAAYGEAPSNTIKTLQFH
ncbi:helix-turn-helix transcriptional regulator [Roseibium salinum]|nr:helix-turn-helix transcriptional regulator [Roseibium salinum]